MDVSPPLFLPSNMLIILGRLNIQLRQPRLAILPSPSTHSLAFIHRLYPPLR